MAPPNCNNNSSPSLLFIFLSLLSFITTLCSGASSPMVPAIYVFGDSLVDVGNNNHLSLSLAKANFPHNGIDFPTKKATGRFTNGKNSADFLAEKVGLETSRPYLSVRNSDASSFLNGVSFASGGAGILDGTDLRYRQSIPLTKQVDYYTTVHQQLVLLLGPTAAQAHFSKSLFGVVIGSNDIFGYFGSSDLQNKSTPQEYVDQMALTLKGQLKRLYENGARKFVVTKVGAIGCCPAERHKNKTHECNEEVNLWSQKYNEGLKAMLVGLKQELKDINFSLFNTYAVMHNFNQKPADYGFIEVKAACCGLGKLNAKVACLPIAEYCSNRRDHLFWDLYHPTQAAASMFVDAIFEGTSEYTFPMNVKRLLSV